MELYQAEWCPHSHKVRQRLTELGLEFVAKQVPAEPDEREELRARTGSTEIPVLVAADGAVFRGEDEILEHLEGFEDRPDAKRHREKSREEVGEFAA
jgi:glutaredoxin 3